MAMNSQLPNIEHVINELKQFDFNIFFEQLYVSRKACNSNSVVDNDLNFVSDLKLRRRPTFERNVSRDTALPLHTPL
jgi:hypothetical protein